MPGAALPPAIVSAPITEGDRIVAHVILEASPVPPYETLSPDAGLGDRGKVYLVNEDAEVLTPSRDLPNTENVVVAAGLLEASGGAGATGLEYRDFTGTPVVGAYAPLPSLGWGVGVEVPADEALAEISQMRWGIVGASAAFLILVVVAAWVITRRVTRPL